MPLLLAIETSTPRASLALMRGNDVIFEDRFESDRHHNALLFAPLKGAIEALGDETLDLVLIGTGPGSYSGTRVGIAAGQGVAMAHSCPAVGFSSLAATSIEAGFAIGDARRGSAWWAEIGENIPQPQLVPSPQLAEALGDRSPIFSFEDTSKLGLPEHLEITRSSPDAAALAMAWLKLPESSKTELLGAPPQPAYLRPPHITKAKQGHPLLRKNPKGPGKSTP